MRRLFADIFEDSKRGPDECWPWAGRIHRSGYGQSDAGAHRRVWKLVNGPIPDGMTIDHLCFNPPCVNPAHLRLLTSLENKRNQRSAKRKSCVNGHPFSEANTYRRKDGRQRTCRACNRDSVARYRAKRGSAA